MSIAFFFLGYCSAALAWYFNHRFVFHGSLGNLPVLKRYRRLHTIHHQNAYNHRRNNFIFIPLWGHALLFSISIPVFLFSPWAWAGCVAFAFVYGVKHHRLHNEDVNAPYGKHHLIHHTVAPTYNFSGVHPIIDKIFGTSFGNFSVLPVRVGSKKAE